MAGSDNAHARHVGLGQRVLAMVNPHVTVNVEETQRLAARGDPLLGQSLAELGGASGGGQTSQFAPQRFDFGRPIQSQHAPQVLGRIFLEPFGRLMRHSAMSKSVSKLVRNP